MIFICVTSGIVILVIFVMFFLCVRMNARKKKDERSDKERNLDDDDIAINVSGDKTFFLLL